MNTILAGLAVGALTVAAVADTKPMANEAFAAALNSGSFVMITLVNGSTGRDWTGCVPAPNLIGAITIEHDLPRTQEGFNQARDIALSAKDHVFTFTKVGAISNLPRHTDGQWAEARSKLRNRSKEDLLSSKGLAHDRTQVGAAATACAIIEKGLMARQQERVIIAEEAPAQPQASARAAPRPVAPPRMRSA